LRLDFVHDYLQFIQGYKHIFTSPSSVEKEPKATRSGNAHIHGMTRVTCASIAYIATQVIISSICRQSTLIVLFQIRFALSSSPVFSRTDTVTDSERFYNSILDFLEDPDKKEEVNELLTWWNWCAILAFIRHFLHLKLDHRQIFPSYSSARPPPVRDCPLARLREKRSALKAISPNNTTP
jgi:hypothetical protein